jgi:uncharacterized protein (DUF58 family)
MSKKTKKILLKARKQVFGEMLGNNASLFQGEGFEFTELREYVYGDDVRKIDWKTTAKLGKPFIKIYREERELNVVTALMLGGSCYFGTTKQKSEVMAELVALLGFASVKNSDLFSHILFADRLYSMSKPSKKFFAVEDAVQQIEKFELLGKESAYKAFSDILYSRLKRKSLLFIISDFVGEVDLALLSKKHDVVALMVRDKFEEKPSELGYIRLMDMESNRAFEGVFEENERSLYEQALFENDEKIYAHFKKNAIRYVKLYTDEDPYLKLAKLLRR